MSTVTSITRTVAPVQHPAVVRSISGHLRRKEDAKRCAEVYKDAQLLAIDREILRIKSLVAAEMDASQYRIAQLLRVVDRLTERRLEIVRGEP